MGNRSSDQYKKIIRGIRRAGALLLAIVCVLVFSAFPSEAAGTGTRHHADTADYCMRVSDVRVGLSELAGLSEGEKQALVERTSDYAVYTWSIPYRSWAERVSPKGDFSSVSWDRAGSYKIRISLPSLTEGTGSEISYILTIIDDLPPELPKYSVTVSYVDGADGHALRDPYVLRDLEEGSPYDLTQMAESIPEGYVLSEIRGELAGTAGKDTEVLILCGKIPVLYSLTLNFVEEETDLVLADPVAFPDLEEGSAYDLTEAAGILPEGYEVSEILGDLTGTMTQDLEITVICRKIKEEPPQEEDPADQDKDKDKDKDKNKGKDPGRKPSGGSSSKPARNNTDKKPSGTSAASSENKTDNRQQSTGEEETTEQPSDREDPAGESEEEAADILEETAETAETAETVSEETQENEETESGRESAALAVSEEEEDDQSDLGGALLPQNKKPDKGLSPFGITVGILEAGILAVLSMLIISDLKVIRWFEEKKKR